VDPFTERKDSWELIGARDDREDGIWDVRSSAAGNAKDGTRYADW
jgi:general secretion pathway protein G